MNADERDLVLQQLAASETRLLALVDGLTETQWTFRETPERWSIAEIIEHCARFEGFILGRIVAAIEAPGEPGKGAEARGKEGLVMSLAETRGTRFIAREAVRPTGSDRRPAEWLAEFGAARARTIVFAQESCAPLRDHFFPHIAFGDLDCCQWLLLLGQHTERHARQIEEVRSHADFPKPEQREVRT